MPDLPPADLDYALERLRLKGFIGGGGQLTVTGLGQDRLNQPERSLSRQPRRQFPRRRAEPMNPQQRDRTLAMATRAAGHDITPGHDELHHYWTREPEGLARWIYSTHPWTTLHEQVTQEVREHGRAVSPEQIKRWVSRWFIEVFGFAAGSDLNRVTHGKPPRGKLVGPG